MFVCNYNFVILFYTLYNSIIGFTEGARMNLPLVLHDK